MIETINDFFSISWVKNFALSIFLFITFVVIIYVSNRLFRRSKFTRKTKKQIWKWSFYVLLFAYILILLRIWAFTDLFAYFKNPLVSKFFNSLLALGIIYLILYFVRRFINSLNIKIHEKHEYRKRAGYAAWFIFFIILIPIWAESTKQWATIISVMGAGIALALHSVLLNLAGWVYIITRRPYKTGDRIELGDVKGDVIDIRVLHTSLLEIGNWVDGEQGTGRLVQLPHGQIFKNALYNYTQGFEYIWNELSITITFESDWKKAKEILLKLGSEESQEIQEQVARKIKRMSQKYLIYFRKFTPIVYTKIEDSGVKLTLRFLTDVKKRRGGEDSLSKKILDAVNKTKSVNFAYPTYRITKE
ncbi:MAG: mechanosensitive ion channel family protein [bacterium]